MRVSGWLAVIGVLVGIVLTVVALLFPWPARPITGTAGAAFFFIAIVCGIVYVVRAGGGVRGWWERLGLLWRVYFKALAAATLVAATVLVLLLTQAVPPNFAWVLVVVWLGAPVGAGVTAAIDRRRQLDAIIHEVLAEQEREGRTD